jgi:CheY-like chemotaxis protein
MARFLIIDDEPTVTETFARALRLQGHDAVVAETAEGALDETGRLQPDAIILDIRMPRLGGLEFLRHLRHEPRLGHTPVGVVTGDYFLTDEVLAELAALRAGVWYKPLCLEDIAALAADLLSAAPDLAAHSGPPR